MSNITGGHEDAGSFSSGGEVVVLEVQHNYVSNLGPSSITSNTDQTQSTNGLITSKQEQSVPLAKKKRNLPGTPDPKAEVIALSPTTLMASNRFICEICSKGFARDQNLQLHRRGHNLPWKLRQRTSTEIKKRVYICPETTCVHHNPTRALGDLTGIKKHFSRKHGEKKWKCDKCSKKYAVQSDWKAHSKTCGTREYKCDCGTIFSRRDSFITHRAFCDALVEANNKVNQGTSQMAATTMEANLSQGQLPEMIKSSMPITMDQISEYSQTEPKHNPPHDLMSKPLNMVRNLFSSNSSSSSTSLFNGLLHPDGGSAHMSATALLQKAAQMGVTASTSLNNNNNNNNNNNSNNNNNNSSKRPWSQTDQTQLVGIDGGFMINQFLQKDTSSQQSSPRFMDTVIGSESSGMNGMRMFNGMLMVSGDRNSHEFLKNMEHGQQSTNTSSNSMLEGRTAINLGNEVVPAPFGRNLTVPRNKGNEDTMTLDFLGIGGGSESIGLHENQHQQQLESHLCNIRETLQNQALNPFQQHLSHGEEVMEKSMWDV